MLLITYSSEHNHHTPPSKKSTAAATPSETTSIATEVSNSDDDQKPAVSENPKQIDQDEIYDSFGEESLINPCEFKWFSELETTPCTIIEMPILEGGGGVGTDGAVILSMREEDESLFGDLGELPGCSVVFRRVKVERAEEERLPRQCNLAPVR